MKRFKKYRPYAVIEINKELYALIQIGIASWVLVDKDGELLNHGMFSDQPNYIKHDELVKLAETNKVKFKGYLEYSPTINEIQFKIFQMLRKDDELTKSKDELIKLKEGLGWALKEMRDLGVTESQEKVYIKIEKLLK